MTEMAQAMGISWREFLYETPVWVINQVEHTLAVREGRVCRLRAA